MSFRISFLIACLVVIAGQSSANPLVPVGECALIVASRKSVSEVRSYVQGIRDRTHLKIYRSSNGWYAISIGTLKPHEVEPVMRKWKASGRIPRDALCSKGRGYVSEVSLSGQTQVTVAPTSEQQSFYNNGTGRITTKACQAVFNKYKSKLTHNPTNCVPAFALSENGNECYTTCFTRGTRQYSADKNAIFYCEHKGGGATFQKIATCRVYQNYVELPENPTDTLKAFIGLGAALSGAAIAGEILRKDYECRLFCGSPSGSVYIAKDINGVMSQNAAEKTAGKQLRDACESRGLWVDSYQLPNPICAAK